MGDKKSFPEIQAEIATAGQVITVGATYGHYKNPANTYKVIMLATREADNELCVVYQALYGPGLYFIRPVKEWSDVIEWEGQSVQRFSRLAGA